MTRVHREDVNAFGAKILSAHRRAMAGAMARGDDDKDEEIARLRGALRRATAAAMAYAETATAELGAMKSRLEQVERKSEEDARTIDELRARVERATTSTSTSNTDATAGIRAAFEAETRRLGERARVAERELHRGK